MKTCQFQTHANGPVCGQATLGTYCWFHENLIAQVRTDSPGQTTHTAGTSNTWATTNTTPELAAAQAMSRTKKPWYSGMKWWKVALALVVIGVLIWKLWPLFILGGLVLLLIGFIRMMMGMNYNRNDNANENVNQVTVSPTITFSPVNIVNVNGDDQ